MTLKIKILAICFIGFSAFSFAQIETYDYKKSIHTISDEWHKLILPEAVFGKLNPNLSDLRIYGITAKTDTIEAPYLLEILSDKIKKTKVSFDIINKTKSDKGYYFTFHLNSEASINQIELDFKEENFDWQVELQGSQNQQEWFTILEDYRILSIKNETTDFKFTKLIFPEAKYDYFRLLVKHKEQPQLQSAQLLKHVVHSGSDIKYNIKKIETKDDKQNKSTEIKVELEHAVPLSHLSVNVSNTFDYYRPIQIEYLADSIKTEKGWKYRYQIISNATLNSLESDGFSFQNTVAKYLKINIFNGDNQPLSIEGVSVKGYTYQLIARFTEPADYMLVYGNPSASQPNYDINKFRSKIPEQLRVSTLGKEDIIVKSEKSKVKPLFENDYWLWAILVVVMLILGGFTLKMLKKS